MNKEWVARKNKEEEEKRKELFEEIKEFLNTTTLLDKEHQKDYLKDLKDYLKDLKRNRLNSTMFDMMPIFALKENATQEERIELSKKARKYADYFYQERTYDYLLDGEPKEFDGDIIITDPCYVMVKEDESTRPKKEDYVRENTEEENKHYMEALNKWYDEKRDDWNTCNYGFDMEALGIHKYMTRDTIYGDWGCTTYNSDTKEEIGEFCADAGLVSVFDLSEILQYNPDFDYHLNRKWTTTLIPDFKGTVQFVVIETSYTYDEDTEYHIKGDVIIEYEVRVVGHGINKKTNEPINFITTQSSL